jgi:hypothetical protein
MAKMQTGRSCCSIIPAAAMQEVAEAGVRAAGRPLAMCRAGYSPVVPNHCSRPLMACGVRGRGVVDRRAISAESTRVRSIHSGVPKWLSVAGSWFQWIGVRAASTRVGVTNVQRRARGFCNSAARVNAVADFQAMNRPTASNMMF